MKRLNYILTCLALLLPVAVYANYPDTLAANFIVPEVDYSVKTKAPSGYKPVYISHYGRHGARFMGKDIEYTRVLEPLATADSLDNLTPLGKKFYDACREYYLTYAKGRAGELTQIGWRQHRDIATAIYKNYPEYFKGHPSVEASATQFQRCIVSMSSFCLALQKCDPKMDIFTQATSYEYEKILNEFGSCRKIEPNWDYSTSAFYKNLNPKHALKRIFKDPSQIKRTRSYVIYLYKFIRAVSCVAPELDLYSYGVLSQSEMEYCYRGEALTFFERYYINQRRAIPVVRNIIDEANEDMNSGECRMKLRFGHDVVITQMLTLLNIDKFGEMPTSADKVCATMPIYRIPMACTVLFVFYKNKEGHTLVKILLDGKETSLPIPSEYGPYYDWERVQEYFEAVVLSPGHFSASRWEKGKGI